MPSSPGFLNVYVTVTDSVGFEAESNITGVSINPALSVGVSPTLVVMDVGQSQMFTSTVSGGTLPFACQWFLNGTVVPSANSGSWISAPGSEGSYAVYADVTDSAGVQVASDIVPVTVLQLIHNIALTDVETSKNVVNQDCSMDATVTAVNLGDKPETFNVTVYANASLIGTQTVNNISNGSSIMLNFIWSTTGFGLGNYTLSAYAWPVLGETDTADNNLTGSWVAGQLKET